MADLHAKYACVTIYTKHYLHLELHAVYDHREIALSITRSFVCIFHLTMYINLTKTSRKESKRKVRISENQSPYFNL